jgi:hypothetical protein
MTGRYIACDCSAATHCPQGRAGVDRKCRIFVDDACAPAVITISSIDLVTLPNGHPGLILDLGEGNELLALEVPESSLALLAAAAAKMSMPTGQKN